jgi:hypothetical protein
VVQDKPVTKIGAFKVLSISSLVPSATMRRMLRRQGLNLVFLRVPAAWEPGYSIRGTLMRE